MARVAMHVGEVATSAALARRLLARQFPQWAELPITRVESSGTDHDIYRLGERLVVRLPRIAWADDQAGKEAEWLPRLAPHLPLAVPVPVALGQPDVGYPFRWSVHEWLPGENAGPTLRDLGPAAVDLARFVAALRSVDTAGAPARATGSRGGSLTEQDDDVRRSVAEPVGLAVGDPACELLPARNVLDSSSRRTFRAELRVEDVCWARGRGRALAQALITLPYYWTTNPGVVAGAASAGSRAGRGHRWSNAARNSALSWGFVLWRHFRRGRLRTPVRSAAGGVMGEFTSALDALAAEDLKPMFGPQLLDRLRELLVLQNRVAAEVVRTVRECELTQAAEHDGLRTVQSWLRGHGRLSSAVATRIVQSGRALEHLPAVAAGFAAGEVTGEAVAVLAPIAAPDALAAAAAQDVDLGEVDEGLALAAATQPFDTVRGMVHRYLACLDPDGPEPDPTESRRLSIATHADGSITGRFDLDAVGGEKVQAAIESIVQAARPLGDTRTRAQQNADALVQLCDNQLASGDLPFLRTQKPQVVVTIPLEDLVDPATGPGTATTGFGAALSAARARWLACDAEIRRLVLDPDGVPLDYGRAKRTVPAGLRQAVEQRDRHCVFAGCAAPTHWCDVHHVDEWLRDEGPTSLANSALLCERHHTKVHHGFRVYRDPDGRWRTWRPDDSEILIGPRL